MAEPSSSSPRTQKYRGVPSFRYQASAAAGRPALLGESPPTLPASGRSGFDPLAFGRRLQEERELEEREDAAALAEYEQAHRSRPISALASEPMPPQVAAALGAELGRQEAERLSSRVPTVRSAVTPRPASVQRPATLPPPVAVVSPTRQASQATAVGGGVQAAGPVTRRSSTVGGVVIAPTPRGYKDAMKSCGAVEIEAAMLKYPNNKSAAARSLGLTREAYYANLRRLGLYKPDAEISAIRSTSGRKGARTRWG